MIDPNHPEATALLLARHPELETPATFADLIEQLGGWITAGTVHNCPEYDQLCEDLDLACPDSPGDLELA